MIFDDIPEKLDVLAEEGLIRNRRVIQSPCGVRMTVDGHELLAFAGNDYLGLAASPLLADAAADAARIWGVGSGGSHVVSGHMAPHEELEVALADFVHAERALFFSTGYMANLAVIPSLVGRGDAVFADRLNHASLIDAVQLSRAASHRYYHNDMAHLASLLEKSTAGKKLIVTDAVFSMDGDVALLPELLELAEKYDTWLVMDDAHGFGVLGKQGEGSLGHFDMCFHPRMVYVGTLGKAAGVSGAFVAASETVVEWLLQRARTYVFSTASSPVIAATLIKSLSLVREGSLLRAHLFFLVERLRMGLSQTRWNLLPSPTAIQPVIIGENNEVLRVANALRERGIFVPAIRPPTVARGSARLRISLSAAHNAEQVDFLVDALKDFQ